MIIYMYIHLFMYLNSLLILQKITTARKSGNIILTYRNIYPDAVNVLGCV